MKFFLLPLAASDVIQRFVLCFHPKFWDSICVQNLARTFFTHLARLPSRSCEARSIIMEPHIIYEDGDLTLIVRNHPFLVSSHALAVASKVLKRILFAKPAEPRQLPGAASSSEPWIVRLPEDNPEAFKSILEMIHHGFKDKQLDRHQRVASLYEITVLTHKYELPHLLREYANRWVDDICRICLPTRGREWDLLAKLLWIGWELGSQRLFKSSLRAMLLRYTPKDLTSFQKMDHGHMFDEVDEPSARDRANPDREQTLSHSELVSHGSADHVKDVFFDQRDILAPPGVPGLSKSSVVPTVPF